MWPAGNGCRETVSGTRRRRRAAVELGDRASRRCAGHPSVRRWYRRCRSRWRHPRGRGSAPGGCPGPGLQLGPVDRSSGLPSPTVKRNSRSGSSTEPASPRCSRAGGSGSAPASPGARLAQDEADLRRAVDLHDRDEDDAEQAGGDIGDRGLGPVRHLDRDHVPSRIPSRCQAAATRSARARSSARVKVAGRTRSGRRARCREELGTSADRLAERFAAMQPEPSPLRPRSPPAAAGSPGSSSRGSLCRCAARHQSQDHIAGSRS